jgi:hypothetical protein
VARTTRHAVLRDTTAPIAGFFGPPEVVPPGLVDARLWCTEWEDAVHLALLTGVSRARSQSS